LDLLLTESSGHLLHRLTPRLELSLWAQASNRILCNWQGGCGIGKPCYSTLTLEVQDVKQILMLALNGQAKTVATYYLMH
jgi:hypothetical protein